MFNRIKSQPLGLFLSPFGFNRKCEGEAAAASFLGSLIGGAWNYIGNSETNSTNKGIALDNRLWQSEENEKNRDWQSEQNKQARQWQEDMYNLYNSPSAMMRQYREAGLNPYMVGQGGVGSGSMSQNPAMSGSPASQSAPGMIPMQRPDFSFVGDSIQRMLNYGLQRKSVDASSADATAKAESQIISNYIELSKIDRDAGQQYLKSRLLEVQGTNFNADRFVNQFDLQLENQRMQNEFLKTQNNIASLTGVRLNEATISNLYQQNKESSERILNLASERRVNEAKIKDLVASMVERYASAYKLRKEGDKYVADTETVNQIRQSVVRSLEAQSWMDYFQGETEHAKFVSSEGFRNWLASSEGKKNSLEIGKYDHNRFVHAIDESTRIASHWLPTMFISPPRAGYKRESSTYEVHYSQE